MYSMWSNLQKTELQQLVHGTLAGLPAYGLLYTSARDYYCAPLTDYFKDLEVSTIDEGEVYPIHK